MNPNIYLVRKQVTLFGAGKTKTKPKKICAKKDALEKYPERGKLKWHPTISSNPGRRSTEEELLVV